MTEPSYDAILLVSFGGPEAPEDVMPFLENVVRGRGVPRERLMEVAEHYHHLGGKSPINDQCRELLAALEPALRERGIDLPLYWGNRNWHPLLPETLAQMQKAGAQRALALVTSAFSSYSGCRQYLENIEAARAAVGPGAPQVHKLRAFYNHPDFIAFWQRSLSEAIAKLPEAQRAGASVLFTAHSIPNAMAASCDYADELDEACGLVMAGLPGHAHKLVYQSRSGPPQVPWLEPDILDALRAHHQAGDGAVVIAPIGFLSDHVEVVWDLDHEALDLCRELGLPGVRAATPGADPGFVRMLCELVEERLGRRDSRRSLGVRGPKADTCAPNCCAYVARRPGARPG